MTTAKNTAAQTADRPDTSPDVRLPDCCHQCSSSVLVGSCGTSTLATVMNSADREEHRGAGGDLAGGSCGGELFDRGQGAGGGHDELLGGRDICCPAFPWARRGFDRTRTGLRIRADPECPGRDCCHDDPMGPTPRMLARALTWPLTPLLTIATGAVLLAIPDQAGAILEPADVPYLVATVACWLVGVVLTAPRVRAAGGLGVPRAWYALAWSGLTDVYTEFALVWRPDCAGRRPRRDAERHELHLVVRVPGADPPVHASRANVVAVAARPAESDGDGRSRVPGRGAVTVDAPRPARTKT